MNHISDYYCAFVFHFDSKIIVANYQTLYLYGYCSDGGALMIVDQHFIAGNRGLNYLIKLRCQYYQVKFVASSHWPGP